MKVNKHASAMVTLRRKSVAQKAVSALPSGEHLRALAFMRELAARVEDLTRGDVHAEPIGREPEIAQPLDKLLLGHDPGAAPGKLALDAFVNVDAPADPAQQQPAEQAAHRPADNDCALVPLAGQGRVSQSFR